MVRPHQENILVSLVHEVINIEEGEEDGARAQGIRVEAYGLHSTGPLARPANHHLNIHDTTLCMAAALSLHQHVLTCIYLNNDIKSHQIVNKSITLNLLKSGICTCSNVTCVQDCLLAGFTMKNRELGTDVM